MGETANVEGRIRRLENLLKDETGVGTGTSSGTSARYPVRQLTLTEESTYDDDGVSTTATVFASWKTPSGNTVPDQIKLTLGSETFELGGTVTEQRKGGFAVGDVVKAVAIAVYSWGNSSAVTAQLTITGSGEAPSTPLNFSAAGGYRTITLSWSLPSDTNYSHMEVWESLVYDNLETAERIAQAYGSELVRANCGAQETRWYWIRAVDTGGNKGEFAGPVSATTSALQAEDVPDGTITGSKLASTLAQKIDNITDGLIPSIFNALSVDNETENGVKAERTLTTKITEGLEAEASERLILAAQLDDTAAAVVEETNARVTADEAAAERVTTLAAQLDDTAAAVEETAEVVAGKPDVYNQTTAPDSSSLKIGDLWVDSTGLIHAWNGSSWEECRDQELVDLMEHASAQMWLKVQASTSSKNVIAGIGVLADTTIGSEITMLADRFYLGASGDGTLGQPFAVDATVASNPKVGIIGNLFVQALKDEGYADDTGWIVGDKIAANSKIQVGDSIFIVGPNNLLQIGDNIVISGTDGSFF